MAIFIIFLIGIPLAYIIFRIMENTPDNWEEFGGRVFASLLWPIMLVGFIILYINELLYNKSLPNGHN